MKLIFTKIKKIKTKHYKKKKKKKKENLQLLFSEREPAI